MEQYRFNGRGSFNHNINNHCNDCRQMNNPGRHTTNQDKHMSRSQMSMQQMSRSHMPMPHKHMNNKNSDCSDMSILTVLENDNSNCGDKNHHMSHMTLGMGYVPMQEWGDIYDLETAHCQGTIFPDLNFVFCGARGKM